MIFNSQGNEWIPLLWGISYTVSGYFFEYRQDKFSTSAL